MTTIPVFVGFWTLAFGLMAAMLASAVLGARHARAGRYAEHRTAMRLAALFLAAFLLAYVLKVVVLGREALALWPRWQVTLLRVHETFVACMLLGGVAARVLARGATTQVAGRRQTLHRLAGRTALWSGVAGLLTAGGLLFGMHQLAADRSLAARNAAPARSAPAVAAAHPAP